MAYKVRVRRPDGSFFDAECRAEVGNASAFNSFLNENLAQYITLYTLYPQGEAGLLTGGVPVQVPVSDEYEFLSLEKDQNGNPC